jgi:hypothetical protein
VLYAAGAAAAEKKLHVLLVAVCHVHAQIVTKKECGKVVIAYKIADLGERGSANGSPQSLPSQPQKQSQDERNEPAATMRPLPLHCTR